MLFITISQMQCFLLQTLYLSFLFRKSTIFQVATHSPPPTLLKFNILERGSHASSYKFVLLAHECCFHLGCRCCCHCSYQQSVFTTQCASLSAGILFLGVQLHSIVLAARPASEPRCNRPQHCLGRNKLAAYQK